MHAAFQFPGLTQLSSFSQICCGGYRRPSAAWVEDANALTFVFVKSGVLWAYRRVASQAGASSARTLLPRHHGREINALKLVPCVASVEDACVISGGDDGEVRTWVVRGVFGSSKPRQSPGFGFSEHQLGSTALLERQEHGAAMRAMSIIPSNSPERWQLVTGGAHNVLQAWSVGIEPTSRQPGSLGTLQLSRLGVQDLRGCPPGERGESGVRWLQAGASASCTWLACPFATILLFFFRS